MSKHIETLLTSIGLPEAEATRIVNLPEADQTSFDPASVLDTVKANYRTQFKNDPAFFNDLTVETLPPDVRKKLESNQYGRAASIARDKLLKGLGFTEAEISDLTPDQKEKLEQFVPAVAEKYAKSKATNPTLQADLIAARKVIEEMTAKQDQMKTEYQTESEKQISAAIFHANLVAELSAIPGLKISATDIAKTAAEIVHSKYGYAKVGDFAVELRQKANPDMKVLKDNSSQELTLKEALANLAKERGWVAESDENEEKDKGAGRFNVDPNKGKIQAIPPHLQGKIGNKIKSEQ